MNVSEFDVAKERGGSVSETDDQFISRWSPRAMSGEPVTVPLLEVLFEAARWAPSCFNSQPWRFVYATHGDEYWSSFYELMVDANQAWARKAGALVIVVSRNRYERNDNEAPTHSFDSGAAWMSLALQARKSALVAHGMQGFDYAAARALLDLPDAFTVEAMVAIGHPGEIEDLPERYQAGEAPTDRKPLREIVFHGSMK